MNFLRRIRAGIGQIYRAVLFGPNGLSLGRLTVVWLIANIWALTWQFVLWVWYVTLTGQMDTAAGLATAFAAILSAILSSAFLVQGFTWWTTKRYGDSGSASRAQINDPNATIGASIVEAPPVPSVVEIPITPEGAIPVELVDPDDPNNPGGI